MYHEKRIVVKCVFADWAHGYNCKNINSFIIINSELFYQLLEVASLFIDMLGARTPKMTITEECVAYGVPEDKT